MRWAGTAEDSRFTLLYGGCDRQFLPEFVDLTAIAVEIHSRRTAGDVWRSERAGMLFECVPVSDSFATSVPYEVQRVLSHSNSDSDTVGCCWVLFHQWLQVIAS